jgi:hypothetical protein
MSRTEHRPDAFSLTNLARTILVLVGLLLFAVFSRQAASQATNTQAVEGTKPALQTATTASAVDLMVGQSDIENVLYEMSEQVTPAETSDNTQTEVSPMVPAAPDQAGQSKAATLAESIKKSPMQLRSERARHNFQLNSRVNVSVERLNTSPSSHQNLKRF